MNELQYFLQEHLLTLMIFVPALGALAILRVPAGRNGAVKAIAVVATLIPLLLSIYLWGHFSNDVQSDWHQGVAGVQFAERMAWIDAFNIDYYVGIDGLSVSMVILTSLISFLGVFASWDFEHWKINRGIRAYFALYLLLEEIGRAHV